MVRPSLTTRRGGKASARLSERCVFHNGMWRCGCVSHDASELGSKTSVRKVLLEPFKDLCDVVCAQRHIWHADLVVRFLHLRSVRGRTNCSSPPVVHLSLDLLVADTLQFAMMAILDTMPFTAEELVVARQDLSAMRDGAHSRRERGRLAVLCHSRCA